MSDEDVGSFGGSSAFGQLPWGAAGDRTMPHQNDPAVFRVLRDACDALVLELDSAAFGALTVRREGSGGGGDDEDDAEEDLGFQRKPCFLIATRYNAYLFKEKGTKLYFCWPLYALKVVTGSALLVLELEESPSSGGGGGGGASSPSSTLENRFEIESQQPSVVAQCSAALNGLIVEAKRLRAREANSMSLMRSQRGGWARGGRAGTARGLAGGGGGARAQQRRVRVLAPGEAIGGEGGDDGDGENSDSGSSGGSAQDAVSAAAASSSDEGDAAEGGFPSSSGGGGRGSSSGATAASATSRWPLAAAAATRGHVRGRGGAPRATGDEKHRDASSGGFNALAALVEGEFTSDYSAVRDAYLQSTHTNLLASMRLLVSENERMIASLCSEHYESFLVAAAKCDRIDASESLAVREEINSACRHVKVSLHDLKGAATALSASVAAASRIARTREAVARCLACAERLEEVEALVEQRSLLAAVRALRGLEQAARRVASTALGRYVLRLRHPQLRQGVMDAAMARTNEWLMVIRHGTARVGAALMRSHRNSHWARLGSSGARRKIAFGPAIDDWCVTAVHDAATGTDAVPTLPSPPPNAADTAASRGDWPNAVAATLGAEADVLVRIAGGASVQRVFEECGQGPVFVDYYAASRRRQLQVEVVDRVQQRRQQQRGEMIGAGRAAVEPSANGADDNEAQDEVDVFSLVLGCIVVEGAVNSVTSPPIHSAAQLAEQWATLSSALVAHCEQEERRLFDLSQEGRPPHQPEDVATRDASHLDPYERAVVSLIAKLRHLILVVCTQLRGSNVVEFDVADVAAVLETLINRLHSKWTQDCCAAVTAHVMSDSMNPMKCATREDYDAWVTRFELHRLRVLGVPPFQPTAVYLPFSASLPAAGDAVLELFTKCVLIIPDTHALSGSVVRHNNIAAMLLEYFVVVFRTVGGVLGAKLMGHSDRAMFQFAVTASHATALRGIVSLVEQRFIAYWGGAYTTATQKFGKPLLLADADAQLQGIAARATEKCATSVIAHVDELLLPMSSLEFWEGRAKGKRDCCVGEMITYVMATVPKLSVAFGTAVVQSMLLSIIMHVAEAVVTHIDAVVYGYKGAKLGGLRAAVQQWIDLEPTIDAWMLQVAAAVDDDDDDSGDGGETLAGGASGSAASTRNGKGGKPRAPVGDSGAQRTRLTVFPVDFAAHGHALAQWIDEREVILAEQAAEELQLKANLEAAGMAVVAAGRATAKGVATVSKATAKGVGDVGKATRKGFFTFGRTVKDGFQGGKHHEQQHQQKMDAEKAAVEDGSNGAVHGVEDHHDEPQRSGPPGPRRT